jgi:tetratricopeptide (TPR) repeat protein
VGVVFGALVLLGVIGAGTYLRIRQRNARREYNSAVGHLRAREWAEAVDRLERAKAWGFSKIEHAGECDLALADAYMRVGRYEEALDAAYRSRQIAEKFGDRGAPGPYLMMARALSYRYAQTGKDRFRIDGKEQLDLYARKALARGVPSGTVAVKCEGAKHRLDTGKLITDEEYIRTHYPSEGSDVPSPTLRPPDGRVEPDAAR